MKYPPCLMHIQINNHSHYINLWLPLFIILPIIIYSLTYTDPNYTIGCPSAMVFWLG